MCRRGFMVFWGAVYHSVVPQRCMLSVSNTKKSEPLLSCCQHILHRRGLWRQGLDHRQLKHLKDVLHNEHILIGCRNKHVKTASQLLAASSMKGYMVVGAKA